MIGLVPDGNGERMVFEINTSKRWVINNVDTNQDKFICRASTTVMDNYADTHCFGAKF